MKILNFVVLCLLATVTASAQVNVQQAPGTYTNNAVVVRDGTGKNVKNAPTLVFGSGNALTIGGAAEDSARLVLSKGSDPSDDASMTFQQNGGRYFAFTYLNDIFTFGGRDSDTFPIFSIVNDGTYRFNFDSPIIVGATSLDISGVNTFDGSTIRTPQAVTINEGSPDTGEWNISLGNQEATIDEATTFTFSGVGTAGQIFRGTIINSSGGAVVATLTGCTPSTTTVAASSTQYYTFESNGSAWVMPGGDPYSPLPIAAGGTGSASPALVAGTNISITGTWPNNTISASSGGSVTPEFVIAQTLGSPSLAWNANMSSITGSNAMGNGIVYYEAIYLSTATTITGVQWYQQTAGNYTANNFNGVALYTYSGGTLTQVAVSANTGTCWTATSNTYSSLAFTSPYAASVGTYFVGMIYCQASQTTAPVVGVAPAINNAAVSSGDFTNSAKLHSNQSGQTTLPSSVAMSATTASLYQRWVGLY